MGLQRRVLPPVQLTLDLPFEEQMGFDDFVVGRANEAAFQFLQQWPEWPAQVAVLSGPQGAGKTHLATIWARLSGAQHHRAKNLEFDSLDDWLTTGALVVEDADLSTLDETALFHLINKVRLSNGFLLITASSPSHEWGIAIPDLMSRLRAAVPVSVGEPDDVMLRQVLVKQFADRQITIEPDVVDYIILRIERSFNVVRDVVARLDFATLSRQRALTKRFAADVLAFS